MKKKVLYGAALALFASVSMGTLQSCKDDLSDLKHQTQYDNKVLQDQINDLKTALDNCKSNCKTEIDALKLSITNLQNDLQKQINDNKADADATKALAQKLEQELKTLSDKVALLYTNQQIDDKLDELNKLVEKYNNDQTEANKTLEATLRAAIKAEVDQINALIDNVKGELKEDYELQISTLKTEFETKYGELPGKVAALEELTETQKKAIEAAQTEIEQLWLNLNQTNENIDAIYNSINDELDAVK
ncbi:MAG: hypothetical protein K2L00_06520, partial [Muribaculaceae bacterium]|nr:hypothetical protein [Muribaculaceae bacterium]